MADFVLVGALAVIVVGCLLQLALGLHVRNVMTDAAGEGARRAALVGGTQEEAEQRVRELVDSSLAEGYVDDVTVDRHRVEDLTVVETTVSAPFPVLGLLGPAGTMTVTGHAVDEASLAGVQEEP